MSRLLLTSIYRCGEPTRDFFERELYYLLGERLPEENISHKEMPTFRQHVKFVRSEPYKHWYVIQNDGFQVVGAVYLTQQNEIGVHIFDKFRRHGHAEHAVDLIMELECNINKDAEFYANINPKNDKSIKLFTKLGFKLERKEPTQHVYKLSTLAATTSSRQISGRME